MDTLIAREIGEAMYSGQHLHPRLDFRTDEAKSYVRWMDDYMKPYVLKDCRFLDVGCASGKHTFKAEELGARDFGIDCSRKAIEKAQWIAEEIASSSDLQN